MKDSVRAFVVASTCILGALFAFGSLIAVRLERDGFTSASRDGMRTGYLGLLAIALAACVVVPFGTSMWAYPAAKRPLGAAFVVSSILASFAFVLAIR